VEAVQVASLIEAPQIGRTTALYDAVTAIQADATRLCFGLSDEQLGWRPEPSRWSIAENFAHLRATTEVFLPAVDEALASLRKRNLFSNKSTRLGFYGRALVWSMEGRPVIKMRAPEAIQPRLLGSPRAELDLFLTSQAALQQRIEDSDGLSLTAFRFPSPLVRCLRVNLLEFFSTFNAHSRRHLRQADKVRRDFSVKN
jgi:hypothetical protein